MLVNTTSETCPTPGKDPDFQLFSSDGGNSAVMEQESDWSSAFRAAIQQPAEQHIPGKIEGAATGVFGLNQATGHSTLNTPTMETMDYGFDLFAPTTSHTMDNEELFQNVWSFGHSPAPAEMVAVAPFLVEGGGGATDNMAEDEGFCPSPDSTPLLSQQAIVEPTPPETVLVPHVEPKVEDPSADLLSWIVNDSVMATSEMPGEVKEEVEIPATLDPSQLFLHYPEPQQDFDRPAQPAYTIVAEKPRPATTTTTKRRGRGRPSVPLGRAITPRLPRRRITSGEESDTTTAVYYSTDEGNLTEAEAEKLRYRRMRDLNNEASKRCRENRKSKFAMLEAERDALMVRNQALRKRLSAIETNVRKLKSFYLENFASGKQLPKPELMWSMLQMDPNEF